jgi:CubicO group peptidase (beta-lactamase class C family)
MHQHRPLALSQDDLCGILESVRNETKVPAIGAVLSIADERIHATVGSAALNRGHSLSEHSRFEMSCLMKLVTSLVALELAARGELNLDDPIDDALPELGASSGFAPITARHLMNHTSGYRGVDISEGATRWGFSWDKLVEHLRQNQRCFPPGSVFNYEHTEHILLAEIIRRRSGRTSMQWAQSLIFDICGIEPLRPSLITPANSAFVAHHVFSDKRGEFVPAALPPFSSFWEPSLPDSTVTLTDIAAIGELLLRALRGDAPAGSISAAAVRNLRQCDIQLAPQVRSSVRHERVPIGFGSAMARYASGLLGHNASSAGQTTALRLDIERGLVIAVGVNAYVPYARDNVIERSLAKLQGVELTPPEPIEFSFDQLAGPFGREQTCGTYVGSYFGQIDVSSVGEQLQLDLGPPRRSARPRVSIVPSANDRFSIQSPVPTLIGFFPDPVSGDPVLAMGVHAYKKQRV